MSRTTDVWRSWKGWSAANVDWTIRHPRFLWLFLGILVLVAVAWAARVSSQGYSTPGTILFLAAGAALIAVCLIVLVQLRAKWRARQRAGTGPLGSSAGP